MSETWADFFSSKLDLQFCEM